MLFSSKIFSLKVFFLIRKKCLNKNIFSQTKKFLFKNLSLVDVIDQTGKIVFHLNSKFFVTSNFSRP